MHDQSKFIIAAVGIFFSYFYFGILQEKITRGRYGDNRNEDGSYGEKFTYTLTLVSVQCFWNWVFAKGEWLKCFLLIKRYGFLTNFHFNCLIRVVDHETREGG